MATNQLTGNGTQITFLEAIKQAMFEEMERDPAVVLLGGLWLYIKPARQATKAKKLAAAA